MKAYDFPVSLQEIYTKTGKPVPRVRAVVREDTGDALAAVSNRYHLVPHADVMQAAESFVKKLGKPERKFYLERNGAVLIGEYTYKDHTLAVNKQDLVGLRVYIENSYNAKKSLRYRIGALVLSCLNGMVSSKDVFSMSYRHVGEQDIQFPEPELVLSSFGNETKKWSSFNHIRLDQRDYDMVEAEAIEIGIVPERVREARKPDAKTVWDLYQQFTYYVEHSSRGQASKLGKISRLDRIARWFDTTWG